MYLAWTRKKDYRYRAGAGLQKNESWSHKQHNSFSIASLLYLSKSVHIGITGQGYKKLAEPAKKN